LDLTQLNRQRETLKMTVRRGYMREGQMMIDEQFSSQIAELQAEHSYLMNVLEVAQSPSDKLEILESLQRLRSRLHNIRDRHINEIRSKRQDMVQQFKN
jgi:hypothetical protein